MSFIENNLKLENTKCILCEEKIPFSDDGVMMCEEYFRHQDCYGGGYYHITEYKDIDWVCLKCFDNNKIEHSMEKTSDLFKFEMIIDDMKSIKEELLAVVFHPSRIEYYLEQGIKIGEFDKII